MLFVLQSIVVGLAVAFLVVLLRPDLLPAIGADKVGQAAAHGRRHVLFAGVGQNRCGICLSR